MAVIVWLQKLLQGAADAAPINKDGWKTYFTKDAGEINESLRLVGVVN